MNTACLPVRYSSKILHRRCTGVLLSLVYQFISVWSFVLSSILRRNICSIIIIVSNQVESFSKCQKWNKEDHSVFVPAIICSARQNSTSAGCQLANSQYSTVDWCPIIRGPTSKWLSKTPTSCCRPCETEGFQWSEHCNWAPSMKGLTVESVDGDFDQEVFQILMSPVRWIGRGGGGSCKLSKSNGQKNG